MSVTRSLEESAREIGANIPSVKLDTSGVDSDPTVIKLKRWLLIGLSSAVIMFALIAIIIKAWNIFT